MGPLKFAWKMETWDEGHHESHQMLWGGRDHFSEVTFKGGISLQCRRILGGRNLVRVRNIIVAAIFDLMTVGDWRE